MKNGGISMDSQRAQEIAKSPNMKQVLYNGEKVYIQHVDEVKDIARIFPIDQPDVEIEVSVNQLKEIDG